MFSLMGRRKFCFELKSAKTGLEHACKLFILQAFSLAYFVINSSTLLSLVCRATQLDRVGLEWLTSTGEEFKL